MRGKRFHNFLFLCVFGHGFGGIFFFIFFLVKQLIPFSFFVAFHAQSGPKSGPWNLMGSF